MYSFLYKNILFLAQAEYSSYSAEFKLTISCEYSYIMAYDVSVFINFDGVEVIIKPDWR